MLDCIGNLVGLVDTTKANCACLTASQPANYAALNVSESGRFVVSEDDYGAAVLGQVFASQHCDDPADLWTKIANARSGALAQIEVDLEAALIDRFDKGVSGRIEEVGERSATAFSTLSQQFAGMQVTPERLKDFKLNVTRIWVGFENAATFDLTVSSTNPDFVQQTISVTTVAGTWTPIVLPSTLVLPFWGAARFWKSNAGHRYMYNISYDTTVAPRPMQNRVHCGCSGSRPRWTNWFEANGFNVPTMDNLGKSASLNAYGLVLDGYISCDNLQWVCELKEANGKDMRDLLALAVKYKATEILAQSILDSPNINRYTLLNREALYGKRNHLRAEYAKVIDWIAYYLPKSATDCYRCRKTEFWGSL